MKEVNMEVIKEGASKLMFDMTEDQYQTLLKEFDIITKQMEKIGEIQGIDEEEQMIFPFDVTVDALREDIPEEPLNKEDVLKNAGSKLDGQIKLPKVVG